ncbi:MAG: flagellar FlbD family protein [Spirochaetaceae bacterium]|jgi:flagellar protein FlbD|nr:flagellar FlbD family protein [Spirochaetaceae bacterium]
MIKVTRLDGREYYLNPHQIELIELKPDTTIIMLSGKQHIVREKISQVLESIEVYRRRINPFINEE